MKDMLDTLRHDDLQKIEKQTKSKLKEKIRFVRDYYHS